MFLVERDGMAKEMSSNLFRMFQFGIEDRRTCVGERVMWRVQERITCNSVAIGVIGAVHAIRVTCYESDMQCCTNVRCV